VKTKEKEFTSFDSQGPTDFDVVGFHLDTTNDILRLIDYCYNLDKDLSEKLDELKHNTLKLKEYVKESN
tara:strand:- start:957 stop:1163 length:207 start_codon:yes stop_codon:yes gene_type:complete